MNKKYFHFFTRLSYIRKIIIKFSYTIIKNLYLNAQVLGMNHKKKIYRNRIQPLIGINIHIMCCSHYKIGNRLVRSYRLIRGVFDVYLPCLLYMLRINCSNARNIKGHKFLFGVKRKCKHE